MLKTLCSNETYFNNCWGGQEVAQHSKKKKNRSYKAVSAKSLQLIYVYKKEDEPEWKLEYKTKASESIATFRHIDLGKHKTKYYTRAQGKNDL